MQPRNEAIDQLEDSEKAMDTSNRNQEPEDHLLDEIYAHFKELLTLQDSHTEAAGAPHDAVHQIIVDHLIDLILVLDSDFIIRYANRAVEDMLRLSPSRLRGKNLFFLLHPDDADKIRKPLTGVWAQPERKFLLKQVRLRREGGGWKTFEAVGTVVDPQAAEPLLLLSFRSTQEEAEPVRSVPSGAEQTSVIKATVGASADYEKQLAIIHRTIELVQQDRLSDSQRYYLQMAVAAIERSLTGIDRFRSFANPPKSHPRQIQVEELLTEFEETVAPLLPDTYQIQIQEIAPDLATIGDPGQVQQVLSILSSNALEAMPGGGKIYLSADESPGSRNEGDRQPFVRIMMRDTGHGIDPAVRPRMFEPYVTTKTPAGNSGLGLAIARRLLAQQGGWIAVGEEQLTGTTMVFGLPRAPSRPENSPEQASAETGEERAVLGKENEDALRDLIQSVVQRGATD